MEAGRLPAAVGAMAAGAISAAVKAIKHNAICEKFEQVWNFFGRIFSDDGKQARCLDACGLFRMAVDMIS
jgi:hypothetical protein